MNVMSDRDIPLIVKAQVVVLLFLSFHVWLVLGMVYFERFLPPFDRLVPALMPWKGLNTFPLGASLGERLNHMQGLLDASNRVAQAALSATVLTFILFIMYLTLVYQQRQRRVHENTILELKNREIARRNEFIRYISATISHEFKNNLGRIKRRIDLLPGVPSDARDRIDGNLDKLFADIEIFKKISDKREAGLIEFEQVDLREMLESIAAQHTDLAEMQVLGGGMQYRITAVPTLLRTVFENLIDNSIKHRKLNQPRARIQIFCSTDRDGHRKYVTVGIRDEGVGMDELQADQCFYKGMGSGGGWGQGLYFAKYVVGLHAGKIRVGKDYTSPGRGTEFIISLPFIEEAADV
jgi:signal transduction histidine kinase